MQSTSTEKRWRGLIVDQEKSGLSVREFAEERGMSPWSLYSWRSKLGYGRGRRGPKPPAHRPLREEDQGLVAVDVVGPDGSPELEAGAGYQVELGGGLRVRVPSGFDERELARLVSVLRSSC